jgi:arylsulfatase
MIRNTSKLACVAACATLFFGLNARAAQAPARPNILLILADDMGYSDASPYGSEVYTPNIARLAAQGMMFSNFHVGAYCAPTRSMLMTGADNHLVGLGNMAELLAPNQRGAPGYEGYLNGRAATLATRLHDAGYHTYMAGKWHLGKTPDTIPAAQGFEDSVGILEGGADNYENKSYSPGYKAVHFFDGRNELQLPPDFYSTQFYTDRIITDIDKNAADGKPFFSYLAFQAVHQPHQAPASFTARYISTYQAGWNEISQFRYERMVELGLMPPGLSLDKPTIVPDWSSLKPQNQKLNAKQMAVYAGMLEYMDMSIGRIVAHLQEKHLLDNTVIVFMSDNGGEATPLQVMFPDYYKKNFDLSYEHLGEKGSFAEYGPGWAAASNTPLSNFKGSASEGGMRAPFIIRYPALIAQGAQTDQFAFVTDVVPTLLDLAGVTASNGKAPLAGHSMVSLLEGKAAQVHPGTEPVGYEVAGSSALYRGDYKLVRCAPPFGDLKWRLYNLKTDPQERYDLTAENPALFKTMMAAFADYAAKNGLVQVPADYNVMVQARANAGLKH